MTWALRKLSDDFDLVSTLGHCDMGLEGTIRGRTLNMRLVSAHWTVWSYVCWQKLEEANLSSRLGKTIWPAYSASLTIGSYLSVAIGASMVLGN